MSRAPLAGLRVLDLTRVLAGPWCTMTLADLGAEVWKIERPGDGDDTRTWRPPQTAHGEASYFLGVNRSKAGLAIDLAAPDGARVARELAAHADVVIENFKTGGLRPFGLDPETLLAHHPRLVYCSISGYGRTGSAAQRPGYDFVSQAESGLMAITGEPDGEPMKLGVAIVDVLTGGAAVQAILAALIARDRDGRGQHVEVALHDVALGALANVGAGVLASGENAQRWGNAHASIVPYQTFLAADGAVVIAVGNDGQFRALCETLGAPELARDARFATNLARVRNRAAAVDALAARIAPRERDALLAELERRNVPAGAVRTPLEALRSPLATERRLVVDVARADGTGYATIASPLRLADTPVEPPQAAPRLGEHTAAVLRRVLHYDDARIAVLLANGAIADASRASDVEMPPGRTSGR